MFRIHPHLLLLLLLITQAQANDLAELEVRTWLDQEVRIAELVEGHDLTLLNVWAVWCPPCRDELPLLYEGHERGHYNLVALNLGDDPSRVIRFLSATGLEELPTYFLSVRQGPQLGIVGLPTTLVLDRQAQPIRMHHGPLDAETLEALVHSSTPE